MPILKLNSRGEVYDPNMGTHNAPLVEDGDVYELSMPKDPKELLARHKAGVITRQQLQRQYVAHMRAWVEEKKKEQAAERARLAKEAALQKQLEQWEARKAKVTQKAVQTAASYLEEHSGVTGDPLDGGWDSEPVRVTPDFTQQDTMARGGSVNLYDHPLKDFMTFAPAKPFGGRR